VKVLDTNEFIRKSRLIHGDRYDYSFTNYLNSKVNVDINCSVHGKFSQLPNVHLMGSGCGRCGYEKVSESHLSSKEKFIQKCLQKYGDKFDYSLVDYKGSKSKVCIIDRISGEKFFIRPDYHLANKTGKTNVTTKRNFLSRALEIHGDKYSYELVPEEIRSNLSVIIVCLTHGEFSQKIDCHLQGNGCPKCARNTPPTIEEIKLMCENHRLVHEFVDVEIPINKKSKISYLNKRGELCFISVQALKDYVNINERLRDRLRSRLHDILRSKKGSVRTTEILGCSVNFLRGYLESKFSEGMTWENYGEWHVDHIVPCSFFDLTDTKNHRICFNYRNLQSLWAKENLSKNDKLPENYKEILENIINHL